MMNKEKETSNRQARKEIIRRREQRSRLIAAGLISVGAILVAFLFIYPSLKPVGAIAIPDEVTRPNVDFNAVGNPDAPIRIDEYSDFQCPFCRVFMEKTEEALLEEFVTGGSVYFVYHSFGAFIGVESGQAAEAAYCAGDQGKFWEMHDIIFVNQTGENVGAYADRRLTAFADTLKLDMGEFNKCFNSNKYSHLVDQDMEAGKAENISATPSFVLSYRVNGQEKKVVIEGAQPIEAFREQIEAALAEMGL